MPLTAEAEVFNEQLRLDSGKINYSDKLTMFLYLLMRDHLDTGTVETLVREVQIATEGIEYTNGWLAQYANNLAERLHTNA